MFDFGSSSFGVGISIGFRNFGAGSEMLAIRSSPSDLRASISDLGCWDLWICDVRSSTSGF